MPWKNEEVRKEYMKNYREQNKEKLKERRLQNKEKLKVNYKNWYDKNKEKKKEYVTEWIKENKEHINEYRRNYYREVISLKLKSTYAMKNKLKSYKESDFIYNRDFDIDEEYVIDLLEKCDYKCENCNIKLKMEWIENYDKQQFSVNRIDNKIGHIKGNCNITCWGCNDFLGRTQK
jgi:hypothetical protein